MKTVPEILDMWPDLSAVHSDVSASHDVQRIAVYRWHRRSSIPAKYWGSLVASAGKRKIKVTFDDLAAAHAVESAA